jgi:hypothetical protein
MRNLLLAVAFALGLGFAVTSAEAATIGGNAAAIQTAAKSGNSIVEKTYYRRRYWGHRRYWRRGYYRPWGYYHRRHYWGRPYWRHHRYWRRHHYWR